MSGVEALRALRSYRDEGAGIEERFVDLSLGGGLSLGVLSLPLDRPNGMGWVVCHSFAAEQVNLQPLEVGMARRLAGSGCSVLRFHSQGYGDSERAMETVTVRSHVADAAEATRALSRLAPVDRSGVLGGRFGGSVAAMTADRTGAAALLMWDPVVDGGRYVRSLLRLGMAIEMAERGRPRSSATDPEEMLDSGTVEVLGFPFTRAVFDELSSLDLAEALTGFRGDSLILQVSPSRDARPELERLAGRLSELGGRSSLKVLVDPEARTFGQDRYRSTREGGKADAQESLEASLLAQSLAWCNAVGCDDRRPQPGASRR